MDEEEELDNTLIGQEEEEAPAIDTGDALMGAGQPMFTADSNVVAAVPGIENIRNPGAFDPQTGDLGNIRLDEPIMSAGTVERVTPFQLAGQGISQGISSLGQGISSGFGVLKDVLNRDQGLFDVDRLGTASDNLLGSAMRNLTPVEELGYTPEPFGKTFTDTFAITRPDGTKFYPDEVTSSVGTPSTLPSSAVETPSTLPSSGMTIDQSAIMNALSNQNQGMDMNQQAISNARIQGAMQGQAFDPNSDEAILARRAEREAQFAPRGPMGPEETRAALGGMTLNEYLNAPAGTPGVSGLRTDPQGRMISTPAPDVVNNFAPQAPSNQTGPTPVLETVPTPSGRGTPVPFPNTEGREIRDALFRGPPQQGAVPAFSTGPITRPLPNDPRGFGTRPLPNDPASTRPGNIRDMLYREPVPNLSDFERESLARQIAIGGTGSFAGDSAAREARLAARPDFNEVRRDSDRRGGISQADARDLAQGMARGATEGERARALEIQSRLGLGQFKPERELTDLEKREIESRIRSRDAQIKTAQAEQNRPEFAGKVYTVNGVTFAQTSRGGAQVIDTGVETPEQSTAQIQNFEFTLDQIDKAREAYSAGDVDRANDILTAAGIQKNGIDVTANEYFGDFTPPPPPGSTSQVTDSGFTQQQEANIQKVLAANPNSTRADVVEAMEKAGKL